MQPRLHSDSQVKILKTLVLAGVLSLVNVGLQAQSATIPAGSKVYISEMPEGLDGYIRAEIMKKKVPLSVVLTDETADYIMTGSAQARKGSWHEGWLSAEKDKSTGSVVIVKKSNPNEVLWAEEAGDRSLMWGSFARGGARKVASRLVDRLKKVVR
jgi:hypothetical protein